MAESKIKSNFFFDPPIATDMDIEMYRQDGMHFNRYDSNTAHTPYSEGLIGNAGGFCITIKSGDYGSQTIYPDGTISFYRREFYYNGSSFAAGSWKSLTPA